MIITISWDIAPCRLVCMSYQPYGRTHCIDIHGTPQKVSFQEKWVHGQDSWFV